MSAPTVLLASTAAPRVGVPAWAGRGVTAVAVLFLGFDIVIKLLVIQPVVGALLWIGLLLRRPGLRALVRRGGA